MLKLILSHVKILIVFICLSMNIHVVHDRNINVFDYGELCHNLLEVLCNIGKCRVLPGKKALKLISDTSGLAGLQ